MADDKKFSEWHGIPRDKIKWNPTVDRENCAGCGMCITGCGRNVYDWDSEKSKPIVARPNNCLVGCITCSNTCIYGCISFPDKEELRKLILELGVHDKAADELRKKLAGISAEKPAGCCGGKAELNKKPEEAAKKSAEGEEAKK